MTETNDIFTAPRRKPEGTGVIAGFFPRLIAFIIDSILVNGPFMLMPFVLPAFAFTGNVILQPLSIALGFAYFTLLNSNIGGGQTLGKRALKIQVVGSDGALLEPKRSLLRYVLFQFPSFVVIFAQNTELGLSIMIPLYFFATWYLLTLFYLYIFNTKTRQTVHDLVASTFVVKMGTGAPPPVPPLWKGHYIGPVFIALFLFMSVGNVVQIMPKPMPELLARLTQMEGVNKANVGKVNAARLQGADGYAAVTVQVLLVIERGLNLTDAGKRAVRITLDNAPDLDDRDEIALSVVDVEHFFSAEDKDHFQETRTVKEWREELKKQALF